jgi:hypothetical protein
MRIPTSTCGSSKDRFSVLYGNENFEWAEIIIFDWPEIVDRRRESTAALEQNHQVLSEIGQRLADVKNKSNPNETVALLSIKIGGIAALSFLTRTNSGAEYKTFYFAYSTSSKSIKIEYKSYYLSTAEENALAFRNAYITHIKSFIGKDFAPDSVP